MRPPPRGPRGLALPGFALLALCAGCAVLDTRTPGWHEYLDTAGTPAAIDLNVESSGQGKPVVLIHGFGNSIYVWRHLTSRLARNNRVIAIDLKGFGASPKPDDDRYSVYEQARLVTDYVLSEDLRDVTLVGHSFGGGVALVASLYLQRSAPGHQRGLVLIDSIAYPQPLPLFIRLLATPVLGPLLLETVPPEAQVRHVLREVYADDRALPEDAVRAYAKSLRTPEGRRATLTSARQIRPQDLEEVALRYSRLRVPTLILWGRQDDIVPVGVGERLHRAIPHSRLVVIKGAGHSPAEERPQAVLPLLEDFLVER